MKMKWWAEVLTLILVVACTGFRDELSPSNTIRAALSQEVTNFYLKDSLQKNVWNFNLLFAQSLFLRTDTAEIVGDLASSMSIDSPLLISVKLRNDAQFHNGLPVTCADVIWSFEDAKHDTSPYKSTFDQIKSWTCEAQVFRIHLKRPIHGLIERLTSGIRIYPQNAFPKSSQAPIGSGPYKFVSTSAQKSVWHRHTEYRGPLNPTIDVIEIHYVPDARTRYEWLKSGKLDLLLEWPVEMDPILKNERDTSNLAVLEYPGQTSTVIGLSLKSECFKKIENRQRFANFVANEQLEGFAPDPLFQLQPKQLPHSSSENEPLPKACDNVKLMFTAQSNFAHFGVPLINALKQKFNIAGAAQESSVFFANLNQGLFDAFIVTLPSENDAVAYYEFLHSSQVPPQKNRFFYANPDSDKVLEQLQTTVNSHLRKRLLESLSTNMRRDLPFISLGRAKTKLVSRNELVLKKTISDHPWLMMAEAVKKNHGQ
jgi:ABC-type transport system substrate-binding protein